MHKTENKSVHDTNDIDLTVARPKFIITFTVHTPTLTFTHNTRESTERKSKTKTQVLLPGQRVDIVL